ncbi:hypothetical protein KC334_g14286, partial [Hortaea werneckii]
EDLQIESGEYFLSAQAKERAAKERREEAMRGKMEERKRKREEAFDAPREAGDGDGEAKKKRKKRKAGGAAEA